MEPKEKTQYPLFPELSEQGKEEAQKLFDKFREKLREVAQEVTDEFYYDVASYIETDSWTNYRNTLMAGFKDYSNRKVQGEHDFKAIRQQIFKDFKEEIIEDLNNDIKEENERLKKEIKRLNDYIYNR